MASSGQYKQSIGGHRTFIPNPLPPWLDLMSALQRQIEDTTHLLGQVEMCRTLLPNANLLIYSSLQREALASSTIEGTIASADELIRFQVSDHSDRQAVREVANYVEALQWGRDQLSSRPLNLNLILGLHERLLAGVRGAGRAGSLKSSQNYIGSSQSAPIDAAVFVPPPPEDVLELMTDLERYLNGDNAEPRIVQCALIHYQFETIHPFHDGNGRVGRLLIILQMIQQGLLSAPLIYPSVYFERNRHEYYSHLQSVRDSNGWQTWIAFFVEGVRQQCQDTITFTQTILQLRERLRTETRSATRRAALQEVLDAFFYEPVLSVRQISERINLLHTSIQPALNDLQAMGIVYEITGKQKGRVYACRPVLDAIFGRIQ
jgi:Fic family protein